MNSPCPPETPALPSAFNEPPRVVIDTQVVMDWLVFRDARVQHVADAVLSGAVRWLVAPAMREELRHVLSRGVASRYAPDLPFIESMFDQHSHAVDDSPPQPLAGRLVCRDPDDQKFIDLALSAQAQWLWSRDKAVLALAKRARLKGLLIVPPERWAMP